MANYNHKKVEKKWQKKWEEANLFETDKKDNSKEKYYILDMFPYPSGEGLHMGHTESYTASDVYYRYKRMQGFNVLHPQGFDSFGLPAENYAIKTGVHPSKTTEQNMKNYCVQWKSLGLGHDLKHLAVTSSPEYFKHTQVIFGKLFENNLVVRKTDTINWCPSCNTGIANEQVVAGECERCGTQIEQKEIPGFFFKITDFAEELINDLDKVDWPEHTIKNQRNWIGKSEGAKIKFAVKHQGEYIDNEIEVFTTRPDTLFGATYMVLAPEHKLVQEFLKMDLIENVDDVRKYLEKTKKKSELDRLEGKEKTGVELKGVTATNPATEKSGLNENVDIPIFISDYVLAGYGTGAIMAVPAHDQRDSIFAKKFGIDIKNVILPNLNDYNDDYKKLNQYIGWDFANRDTGLSDSEILEKNIKLIKSGKVCFWGNGILQNSGDFNGLEVEEAKKKITEFVGGELTSNYKLRDWSISRQRYWGCPIPIVYSPEGEAKFVGDENLPWLLPTDVDFVPTGIAPLAKSEELKERTEKLFGKGWKPEVDTMDTFVDSSWYFLRYPDTENKDEFCSKEMLKKWMPVDLYIGGAEHTYMHLLFSRFFVKAMKKIGMIDFDEPFLKLRHQGMVNDQKGNKMSKSKGNVVNPNDMIERFGADSVRTYMLFSSPLEDEVMWNEDNIVGVYRFLEKIIRQKEKLVEEKNPEIEKETHKIIKKVTEQVEILKFNTAVSDMMKFVNFLDKQKTVNKENFVDFLKLLSPFTPHIADELYNEITGGEFLIKEVWPKFEKKLIEDDTILLTVQVNGKRRGEIEVSPTASQEEVEILVKENEEIQKWLEGGVKKVIYIAGRILNFVI